MNGHDNLEGEFLPTSAEVQAVDEIIRDEEVPITLESIAAEIQAMTTLNHVLNSALNAQIERADELQKRIDEMNRIAAQIVGEVDEAAWYIVEGISDTGTHAERSMSILAVMRKIRGLVQNTRWDISRIYAASQGDNSRKHQDYDDVPF